MTRRTNSLTVTDMLAIEISVKQKNVIDTLSEMLSWGRWPNWLVCVRVTLTTNAQDAVMLSQKFSVMVSNSTKQFKYYLLWLQIYYDKVQPVLLRWLCQSHSEFAGDERKICSSYHMYFAKITRTRKRVCSTQGKYISFNAIVVSRNNKKILNVIINTSTDPSVNLVLSHKHKACIHQDY